MCGIVGIVDTERGRVDAHTLDVLCEHMRSRGPDGAGSFRAGPVGMAMRRLAVIDLAEGDQPFFSRNGAVVAFQNGEIYNHAALQRELEAAGYVFRSRCDTEVLAHGYDAWGIDGLASRLDGMFAAAIWDADRRQLHLLRDRFGEKPLFFARSGRRFAYGSDALALSALEWVDDAVESLALSRYLALGFSPGTQTLMRGVERVLPGERFTLSLPSMQISRTRFAALPEVGDPRDIPAASTEELEALLVDAVGSRGVADVPTGIFLSGGLDSSLVAAMAARRGGETVRTFSMGFRSAAHDESEDAERVAAVLGTQHRRFVFDESHFADLLPRVVAALDEPVGDQALLPLYWLCHEASQEVKVVLSGEGADEAFGGYDYYQPYARRRGRGGGDCTCDTALLCAAHASLGSGFPLLTHVDERRLLTGLGGDEDDAWSLRTAARLGRAANPLQRATLTDAATWLPDDLLVKFDRMAMAHSLEGRAPYLAPALFARASALPSSRRLAADHSKIALREVAARWLPREACAKRKQGFVLPMAEWLRAWFDARGPAKDYFAAREVPGLDVGVLAQLAEQDLAGGVQRERFLFAVVVLVEWVHAARETRSRLRAALVRA